MKYLLLSVALLLGLSACTYNNDHGHPAVYKSDYTTFVYTINPTNWIQDGSYFYSKIRANEITSDILSYGYFITYMNIGTESNPIYSELPQTQVYTDDNGVTYSNEFYPTYSLGNVRIEYFDTHPEGTIPINRSFTFRTVVISDPYVINGLKNNEISREYESVIEAMNDQAIDNKQVILD